jgi:2-polyprenyl-3-methyl-5-hydroxy-6-metoxy-1,4-benzoquinol methylase
MSQQRRDSDYYDDMYLHDDRTYERSRASPYYPLFSKVCQLAKEAELGTVLEVGCGSGVLAEMLIASGMRYEGFDISPVAIEKARKRNPEGRFFVGDATDPAAYRAPYDLLVCCEVLEHVDEDLAAMGSWKSGSTCICSVPNFDYESHVRFFHSVEQVRERYGGLLDIRRVERVAKSARANLSAAEYFRRIRWARNEPTRLLGILGVNAFAWYGGWFVFVGQRR